MNEGGELVHDREAKNDDAGGERERAQEAC